MRICGMALASVLALAGTPVAAQEWPQRLVRMIMPTPAGTAPDITARLIADRLSRTWSQQVLVDNRPGAGGVIGMQATARAPADGYTLVFAPAFVFTVSPHTIKEPGFDLDRDFTPVARITGTPMVIAANLGFEANNLAELIEVGRRRPKAIDVATTQYGSLPYLTSVLTSQISGIELFNVPFPGTTQAVTSALGGDTPVIVDGTPALLPHVASGKLKVLAITASEKLPGLEAYPLAKETVPGLDVLGWFGVAAPRQTPPAVLARINADINKAMAEPAVAERLRELGAYPMPGSIEDFAAFLATERARWAAVIKKAGIEPQ